MKQEPAAAPQLVQVLREAAPYLQAHRRKTFVVQLARALADSERLSPLLADIALLRHICEIRFALAYDAPACEGPVSSEHLAQLRAAAATSRDRIEQLLAAGAPGGIPGAGCAGSNLVSARRAGIIGGIDQLMRGTAARVDPVQTRSVLDAGMVALLPPLGFASDGSAVLLDASETSLACAAATAADKLIVIASEESCAGLGFRELTAAETEKRIAQDADPPQVRALLQQGADAVAAGIERIHFISEADDGCMLLELLTPDGCAAMVSRDPFDAVRQATPADVPSIAELLAPGTAADALLSRSPQQLAERIADFAVLAHDDTLLACAALETEGRVAEIRSLAVRANSMNQARGELLLKYCERKARAAGAKRLLAVSTQARDWFVARGFAPADPAELPPQRRDSAGPPRNAAVVGKSLAD